MRISLYLVWKAQLNPIKLQCLPFISWLYTHNYLYIQSIYIIYELNMYVQSLYTSMEVSKSLLSSSSQFPPRSLPKHFSSGEFIFLTWFLIYPFINLLYKCWDFKYSTCLLFCLFNLPRKCMIKWPFVEFSINVVFFE